LYFILAGLDVLNLLGTDTMSIVWGLSAMLTGFLLHFQTTNQPWPTDKDLPDRFSTSPWG
jgi:hypothetical protein